MLSIPVQCASWSQEGDPQLVSPSYQGTHIGQPFQWYSHLRRPWTWWHFHLASPWSYSGSCWGLRVCWRGYVSEHALQFLWRLSYQDYIIGKDQVWQVFTVYVDSFVLPVDFIDNGVLQTCSKEFGWYVVALSHSPLQLDLVAVPVELQGRCSAIIKIS